MDMKLGILHHEIEQEKLTTASQAQDTAEERKESGLRIPGQGYFERSQVDVLQKDADLDFQEFWSTDASKYAEKLHRLAIEADVKDKRKKAAPDVAYRDAAEQKRVDLAELSLADSKRSEKSRKNHMSDASKAYEEASASHKEMMKARKKNDTLAAVKHAETMISSMCKAEMEQARAYGNKDASEKRNIAGLEIKRAKMLLNLYEEAMKDPLLSRKDQMRLEDKCREQAYFLGIRESQLHLAKDANAGVLAAEKADEFRDIPEDDIFLMAQHDSANTDEAKRRKIWGRFGGTYFNEEGRSYGYIRTWICSNVNQYARARAVYRETLAKARKLADEGEANGNDEDVAKAEEMFKEAERTFAEEQEKIRESAVRRVKAKARKGATEEELAAYSRGFLSKLDETFDALDSAAKECVLPEDSRVYRMVDKSILSWGFGIKNYEGMTPSEIVHQINLNHGKLITDHGYMSTGYCLSQYFHKSPFMLTLLTPKGKQCYVTANFEEAEIIFGRDTTYSVVCAVDHSEEAKKMKISSTIPDGARTADEIRTNRTFAFKGIEIICKME